MRFASVTAGMLLAVVSWAGLPEISSPITGLSLADLHDVFDEVHNGHAHEAIDIMASRGTPVHVVAPGKIVKLFLSKAGGNTVYQFDETGRYCFYYAHLDAYAAGLKEGARLERGDVIGFVGSTGNARPDAPHLHFAVFELGPEKLWWKGTAINPYAALVSAVHGGK